MASIDQNEKSGYRLANRAYEIRAKIQPEQVQIDLTDRKSALELCQSPYYYCVARKTTDGVLTTRDISEAAVTAGQERLTISGKVGGLNVEHEFFLPKSENYMEERLVLFNPGSQTIEIEDFEAGMVHRITDERGNALPAVAQDRFVAIPLRHRAESPKEFDHDFTVEDFLTYSGSERRHIDPWGGRFPSRHRHAEGWAWMHGDYCLGLFKFNQANMEFSVLSTLLLPDGLYLRFGGAVMIDESPAALSKIESGQKIELGVLRYQTDEGDYTRSYYHFRDFLDQKGCRFPGQYNPPVHWNELYDNPEWDLSTPGKPAGPRDTRRLTYTRELIEREAAKAREYSCESLYLDPGWDTAFATFLWGEEWLGPAADFVSTIKKKYGLGVSLHCPLATWMCWEGSGVYAWPEEAAIKGADGRAIDKSTCLGSKQYLDEAERRLQELCEKGVVFLMFDGNWWNGSCWNEDHGHPVPYTKEDHCRANLELARRVHKKYPEVLIEMHDMICGGARYRYTPVYYKYGLEGSYDENWGFELMWQTMEDILSGRARSLYYYNLGCNVPIYLHVDIRDDNEHCLVLWWYASTCRHLGIGGTHHNPQIAKAQKKAMQLYKSYDRFYKRGEFFGISEEIHLHVLPQEGAFVVNLFNMSDDSRIIEGSIGMAELGLDTDQYYIMAKGCSCQPDDGTFTVSRRLPPWSAQVAEIEILKSTR